ncbi:MAG: helix-turn-helix domain-containing protein [Corynebacteriales bacterium]|nr:helix-turn-helix domain-containing protein [Mycobacteriales bacterium]
MSSHASRNLPRPKTRTPQANASVRASLGERLREIRADAGLTARALAQLAGWHDGSKVSKIEHGRQMPSASDIRAWCVSCGAEGETSELLSFLHGMDSLYVEWRRKERGGLRKIQEASAPRDQRSNVLRLYESDVIPGLLQTKAYATALLGVIAEFRRIPNDAELAAEARIARQKVLHDGKHRCAILMEENVLRTVFGSAETMCEQLDHLARATTWPSVSVGVIPMGRPRSIWPTEGFWLYDTEKVLVELSTAELTITQSHEVHTYAQMFQGFAELALYGTQARSLIADAKQSLQVVV